MIMGTGIGLGATLFEVVALDSGVGVGMPMSAMRMRAYCRRILAASHWTCTVAK